MHPSHLWSCAVTVSTLSPAGWILLLQSLWELNHIFTCGQLTHRSYPHAYVTANLPFTCSEPHSSRCTEESSRLLSVSVAAVRSSSPCVAVALLLFAANPTQTEFCNKWSESVFEWWWIKSDKWQHQETWGKPSSSLVNQTWSIYWTRNKGFSCSCTGLWLHLPSSSPPSQLAEDCGWSNQPISGNYL